MTEKRKVLIPAAGYGIRAGKKAHESKELLIRETSGQPLIIEPIVSALALNASVHVIIRKEKDDLAHFLQTLILPGLPLHIQIINASKDWPDTLLKSQEYWAPSNLVLLPDLEWKNHSVAQDIFEIIETTEAETVWGGKTVEDSKSWGIVNLQKDGAQICEKPQEKIAAPWAWGLLGFKKNRGQELLEKLLESSHDHQWKSLSGQFRKLELEEMCDLTRLCR